MAGDWIKMRTNLWDDPRVSMMCDLTGESEVSVIGALYWLWSAADEHSEDGILHGLSLAGIDRKTRIKGIGAALVAVGWLVEHHEGVRIVRFEEHNGSSAKRRCSESRRKMSARDADNERTESGSDAEESSKACGSYAHLDVDVDLDVNLQPNSEQAVVVATMPPAKPAATAKRGSRLPDDWKLPMPWGEWALAEKPGWTADDVRRCADKFRDHWHAAAGRTATKADWQATWRNWVRNEQGPPQARASPGRMTLTETRTETLAGLTGDSKPQEFIRHERDITAESARLTA